MAILPPSKYFPPAETAPPEGLIGFGGRLTLDWLLDAYRHGIFPWPIAEFDEPLAWWSPDPRAIFDLDHFHVPRRLARTIRGGRFQVTRNRDFRGVIQGCATAPGRRGNTWLTPAMRRAYLRLHKLGFAHSVESWQGNRLVGGVYGVAIGGLFAAESMFHLVPDAANVALVHLREHSRQRGYVLFDIQMLTPHTARLGAIEIPRREYLHRLALALEKSIFFGD